MRYLFRFRDLGDGMPPYRCGRYNDDGLTPKVEAHASAEAQRSGHTITLRRPSGSLVATFTPDGGVNVEEPAHGEVDLRLPYHHVSMPERRTGAHRGAQGRT